VAKATSAETDVADGGWTFLSIILGELVTREYIVHSMNEQEDEMASAILWL
jgi:hypothetical protein